MERVEKYVDIFCKVIITFMFCWFCWKMIEFYFRDIELDKPVKVIEGSYTIIDKERESNGS